VDRDEEGAVAECALDLDVVQEVRHRRLDVAAAEDLLAESHEIRHRVVAIADELLQGRRQERGGLAQVETAAAGEALLRTMI
jgi:hypothetical protein